MTGLDDFYYFNTEVVQGFALTSVLTLLRAPSPQPLSLFVRFRQLFLLLRSSLQASLCTRPGLGLTEA